MKHISYHYSVLVKTKNRKNMSSSWYKQPWKEIANISQIQWIENFPVEICILNKICTCMMHLSSRGGSEKFFPPFSSFATNKSKLSFQKSFFSDFTRKWVVKGWWINEGGLPSYFQQAWPPAPASLTAVWTPKTFQTNFPFPDILLPSRDAQSGRDFQWLYSGNSERHWRDKLLGDDSKTFWGDIIVNIWN